MRQEKTKTCSKCAKTKSISEFHKKKTTPDGRHYTCKDCEREYQEKFKKEHPDKLALRYRKHFLKKNYGISLEEYDALLKKQKGVCAVCGLPQVTKSGQKQMLSVDHNHNTGAVRGLLCTRCNNAIGALQVDNFGIMNLQTTIKYLQKVA